MEGESTVIEIPIRNCMLNYFSDRMLVLDDQVNLAESDLIYTQTLMNHKEENYRDKHVLILGKFWVYNKPVRGDW